MNFFRKNTALALLATLLFLFGLGAMTMRADEMGGMSNCPWMSLSAICRMNIFEHISIFQSLFMGVPTKAIGLVLVLLSAFLITYAAEIFKVSSPPMALKFFLKESRRLPNFNPVLAAIADGTVQPKLYA